MKDNLILQNKNYISAKQAAIIFGYASDYIGQLCRAGKLECKMIGRSWFVTEESLRQHKTMGVEESKIIEEIKISFSNVPHSFALPYRMSENFSVSSLPFYEESRSAEKLIGATLLCVISLLILINSFDFHTNVFTNLSKSITENINLASIINIKEKLKSFNGLAITPSSGTTEGDENIKDRIRNSFSDEVFVKPDSTGNSGIITPVFRKATGDDFVYVMVPVIDSK